MKKKPMEPIRAWAVMHTEYPRPNVSLLWRDTSKILLVVPVYEIFKSKHNAIAYRNARRPGSKVIPVLITPATKKRGAK